VTAGFTESVVEDAALAWLESAGWQIARADLIQRNRALHRLLVDRVTVEYRDACVCERARLSETAP
jgi:hypothetical protein